MSGTSSFTQKVLRVTITRVDGTAPKDATNATATVLTGLRMSCSIKKMGHPSKNTCRLKIYGMTQALMTLDTVVPNTQQVLKVPSHKKLYLSIEAGDSNGLTTAFEGEITAAYSVYHSPPNMLFHIEATLGLYPALNPAKPISYQGAVDVAWALQKLAASIGYGFENNGVSGLMVANPYLTGSAIEQMRQLADAVQSRMEFQLDDLKVCISPKNVPRLQQGQVPYLSAKSGMKEYPIFDKHGLKVVTLFYPGLALKGQIYVKSAIDVCTGYWFVQSLEHELESLVPNGKWESRISASKLKDPPADVQQADGLGGGV